MKVLVGCEFSGVTREAFAKRGHIAVSVDLLPSEQTPSKNAFHVRGDISEFIDRNPGVFDLLIAFPPCRYLAVSGARWFKTREKEQLQALNFVKKLLTAPVPRICLENPVGVISTQIRKPDQIVHPWMFGHGEVKATCLWLKNLPELKPTNIVDGREPRVWKEPPGEDRWKRRSRTYPGIAEAMADQWGSSIRANQTCRGILADEERYFFRSRFSI